VAEEGEEECVAPSVEVTDALTDAEFNEHRLEIGLLPSESIVRQISANRASSPRASGTTATSTSAAASVSNAASSASSSLPAPPSAATVSASSSRFNFALFRRYIHIPYTPIDHSLLPASRLTPLFKKILTSNSLHIVSAFLIGIHCILFYAALLGFYFLFFSASSFATSTSSSLSVHAVWGFIVFFVLLSLRSLLNIFLCAYRVRVPVMWINDVTVSYYPTDIRPVIHRLYHSCQHALQFWSMIIFSFTLVITIISCVNIEVFSPVQVLVIALLVYEFCALIAPLVCVAFISRFIPYRLLHWSVPFLPVTIPTPKEPSTGLTKEVIEKLGTSVYHKSAVTDTSSSEDGLICAICYADVEDGETTRILPGCQHEYHQPCIDPWLLRKASCPLCVRKVTAPIVEV
jgi:hypothetical protein